MPATDEMGTPRRLWRAEHLLYRTPGLAREVGVGKVAYVQQQPDAHTGPHSANCLRFLVVQSTSHGSGVRCFHFARQSKYDRCGTGSGTALAISPARRGRRSPTSRRDFFVSQLRNHFVTRTRRVTVGPMGNSQGRDNVRKRASRRKKMERLAAAAKVSGKAGKKKAAK